ncbi:MAG: glycogen/starch synthase [Nanoarchaeota archaeon]
MKENDFLFEISWEICNKVGGIYTVISSKARIIKSYCKNYFVIGPYFNHENSDFIEKDIPENFKIAYDELLTLGIKLHFGKWNIGNIESKNNNSDKQVDTNKIQEDETNDDKFNVYSDVNTILIEYLGYAHNINDIKSKLWELYNIDSLNSKWYDFDEVILWSWCCGIVIEKLKNNMNILGDIYVHAHEWMSGGSIFYLKSLNDNSYKTIFTTHATMLGRTLGGRGENVYNIDDGFDVDKKVYEYGIHTKHQTEKALAHFSDAFTTVSQITQRETEKFYDKIPDKLLYNGFDNFEENFLKDIDSICFSYKNKIIEFLKLYFKQFYEINFDNTKIFYTSGRNEFRNKGIDIYIKSLGKLNNTLKMQDSDETIINLFLIPIGNFPVNDRIFSEVSVDMKSQLWDIAPLSTHKVPLENDIISNFFKEGLFNKQDDRVKVILIPIYLNENDGVFNEKYYDVIKGMDLGVFPSYYEPWGYTPLESISYGVPTITSDLSGFGRAILSDYGGSKTAVKILDRMNSSDEESIISLFDILYKYSKKDLEKLNLENSAAYIFSKNFSWKIFIKNYLQVYDIARDKVNGLK